VSGRARWPALAAAAVLVLGVAGGVWLALSGDRPAEPPPAPQPPSSPKPPAYSLDVTLRRVKGLPVVGKARQRRLRQPAEAVRRAMTDLYSTGFVDPARWEGGRFPALVDHFAGDARREARGDLEDLTLGRAAGHLTAVRPEWARLDVRFLVGPGRQPVAAMASMRFAGTGIGATVAGIPVRHRGEFLMHRIEGRWLIVAYDVKGYIGSGPAP